MTVTAAQLRTDFPEFADTTLYPDSGINFWLNIAGNMLNASRFGNLLDVGTELFTAHNIVLERQAQAAALNGAPPGIQQGPISSKGVDKVSISYDTQAAIELEAGHWNLTVYGTRFIKLARMFGAGPVQIGAGCGGGPLDSVNAWAGPWPWNFPNPS